MYSYEIERLLKIKDNLVTLKEYIKICDSEQIDHIKYEKNKFKIWTNDEYYFEFKLICQK